MALDNVQDVWVQYCIKYLKMYKSKYKKVSELTISGIECLTFRAKSLHQKETLDLILRISTEHKPFYISICIFASALI